MNVEIKFPEGFNDTKALTDYFAITDGLARKAISSGAWLRVKEATGMQMLADPRFNGSKMREAGPFMDASWWLTRA